MINPPSVDCDQPISETIIGTWRVAKDTKELLRRGHSLGAILRWPASSTVGDSGLLDGHTVAS